MDLPTHVSLENIIIITSGAPLITGFLVMLIKAYAKNPDNKKWKPIKRAAVVGSAALLAVIMNKLSPETTTEWLGWKCVAESIIGAGVGSGGYNIWGKIKENKNSEGLPE